MDVSLKSLALLQDPTAPPSTRGKENRANPQHPVVRASSAVSSSSSATASPRSKPSNLPVPSTNATNKNGRRSGMFLVDDSRSKIPKPAKIRRYSTTVGVVPKKTAVKAAGTGTEQAEHASPVAKHVGDDEPKNSESRGAQAREVLQEIERVQRENVRESPQVGRQVGEAEPKQKDDNGRVTRSKSR